MREQDDWKLENFPVFIGDVFQDIYWGRTMVFIGAGEAFGGGPTMIFGLDVDTNTTCNTTPEEFMHAYYAGFVKEVPGAGNVWEVVPEGS